MMEEESSDMLPLFDLCLPTKQNPRSPQIQRSGFAAAAVAARGRPEGSKLQRQTSSQQANQQPRSDSSHGGSILLLL